METQAGIMAASNTSKPTIVFIIGAWHTTFHSQPVAPLVEEFDYRFVPVKLPSVGRSQPRPSMQTDIQAIHNTIVAETSAGKDIALVLHSYAGVPGRQAVNQYISSTASTTKTEGTKHGKILKLIFIGAQLDKFDKEIMHPHYGKLIRHSEGYNYINDPYTTFYNTIPLSDAQKFIDALEPQTYPLSAENIADPTAKLEYRETEQEERQRREALVGGKDWLRLPCVSFVLLKDQSIRPEYQLETAKRNGLEIVEVEWDHSPMITAPGELAKALDDVLKKQSVS
jgi:pimeloyl-ACP methyl ester carboxylesterase